MFRIECFCEDKRLAKVMRLLAEEQVANLSAVPVANAETNGGRVVARTTGEKIEMFADWLKANRLRTPTPDDVRRFQREHGYAEGGYSLTLQTAVAAKVLRKKGGPGLGTTYEVVAAKPKSKTTKRKEAVNNG